MAYKKRVRAAAGGQAQQEKKVFRGVGGQLVSEDAPGTSAQPRGIMGSGTAAANEFVIDPDTLEFPLKGFVKDPFTNKNIDIKRFQKAYPGIVLPGDAGYKPKQRFRYQRQEGSGAPKLLSVEEIVAMLKAAQAPTARAARGGRARAAAGGAAMKKGLANPRFNLGNGTTGKPLSTKPGATPLVPLQQQRINDIQADTSGITSLTTDLRNFQPGGDQDIASLRNFEAGGTQDINALRGFQPLTGLGASTQNELLSTGFRTNVDPLTEAAKIRAGQEFDTATSGINERLAAQGLISSSAQTAAEARERARMGERIGATGLEAGVAAEEAAAARRVGGIGNELAASGQRLGATGQAGQLALGQSGQNLDARSQALSGSLAQSGQRLSGLGQALGGATSAAGLNLDAAQSRAGAGQGLINSQMPQFGQEMGQAPAGGSAAPARKPTFGYTLGRARYGGRAGYASGGRVDLGDFLSKMLYGQEFTRRGPTEQTSSSGSSRMAAPRSPTAGLEKEILREQLQRLRMPTSGPRKFEIGPEELGTAAASTLDPGNRLGRTGGDFAKLGKYMQFLGPDNVGAGTRQAGAGFAQMGSAAAGAAAGESASKFGSLVDAIARQPALAGTFISQRQRAAGGGVPQPDLPQEMGIQELSAYDPRRRFYDEGGGVAPGIDTGEDKIPALLRSEELVLTPELAQAVTMANPLEPNPELIMALQDLAKQPLEFSEGEGEFMAAEGGSAPRFSKEGVNLKDVFNSIFGLSDEASAGFDRRYGIPPQGFEEEFDVPAPPSGAIPGPRPAPSLPSREDLLRQGAAATLLESRGVPSSAEAGQDFGSEELGPAPGSVSLERVGGGPLTQAGDAGFGRITPQPGRQGSFSAMTTTVPSAQPLTPEQQVAQRLTAATQRRDLIASALTTDQVGSPEKQARLLNALESAERQVNNITSEVLAREQTRLMGEQTTLRQTMAEANVNESMANILRAKAQQQTAEAALAKQMLEASAADPVVGQILNSLEKLGGIKDPRTAAQYEAVFGKLLESRGIQIRENGWLRRLFGAPEFEVEPSQAEAGAAPVAPGDDVTSMLATSRQPITPDMLAFFGQFAGAR